MGKYVQWITYKSRRMVFLNGAGLREPEYVAALEELKQELLKEKVAAMVLVDLRKTEMTKATSNKAKEVAAATKAAGIPDGPNAVVGLSAMAKAVAQLFARGARYFESIDEAKEWLVKEDEKRSQRDSGRK